MLQLRQTLHFNSRPHGGRPENIRCAAYAPDISTHALTEGDAPTRRCCSFTNISTHALTEGDLPMPDTGRAFLIFQLTPSRRATRCRERCRSDDDISTHALTEGDDILSAVRTRHENFNSRPHGGRLPHALALPFDQGISTHALTEGDCKFRQIFLLNRGYAYSISLYFLPHFISLLPQILSFQQKPFKFQVRIFLLFSVHLAFALQNQCVHHVKSRFCTNMFYFVFVLFTQIVKSQTISLFIYDFF